MTRETPAESTAEPATKDLAVHAANGGARVARAGAYVTGGGLMAVYGEATDGAPTSRNTGWEAPIETASDAPTSPILTFPDLPTDRPEPPGLSGENPGAGLREQGHQGQYVGNFRPPAPEATTATATPIAAAAPLPAPAPAAHDLPTPAYGMPHHVGHQAGPSAIEPGMTQPLVLQADPFGGVGDGVGFLVDAWATVDVQASLYVEAEWEFELDVSRSGVYFNSSVTLEAQAEAWVHVDAGTIAQSTTVGGEIDAYRSQVGANGTADARSASATAAKPATATGNTTTGPSATASPAGTAGPLSSVTPTHSEPGLGLSTHGGGLHETRVPTVGDNSLAHAAVPAPQAHAAAPVTPVIVQPVALTPLQTTIQPLAAKNPIAELTSISQHGSALVAPAATAPTLLRDTTPHLPATSAPMSPDLTPGMITPITPLRPIGQDIPVVKPPIGGADGTPIAPLLPPKGGAIGDGSTLPTLVKPVVPSKTLPDATVPKHNQPGVDSPSLLPDVTAPKLLPDNTIPKHAPDVTAPKILPDKPLPKLLPSQPDSGGGSLHLPSSPGVGLTPKLGGISHESDSTSMHGGLFHDTLGAGLYPTAHNAFLPDAALDHDSATMLSL